MHVRRHSQAGVTLMELMVVVGIIGILAAIAYPSYTQFVMQTNRTDATKTLQLYAQSMERCYSVNFTYLGCTVQGTPVNDQSIMGTPNNYYTVTFNIPDAQDYSLVAVATAAPQTNDFQCFSFTLLSTGQVTSADNNNNPTNAQSCWGSN